MRRRRRREMEDLDMQDSQSSSSESGVRASQQSGALEDSRVQPSSSRMLTNYLADVEQNLDEHRWEMALRDVVDLPKIVVALADPEFRSSSEGCKAWCQQWVRPPSTANESGVDQEHICRVLDEKSGNSGKPQAIPSVELRRL